MAVNIIPPDAVRPILDSDSSMNEVFRGWARNVTQQVNDRSLIFGTGNPEGIISAKKGTEYMDETGTSGNIKYIKRDTDVGGDQTQGWILC